MNISKIVQENYFLDVLIPDSIHWVTISDWKTFSKFHVYTIYNVLLIGSW